MTDKDNASMTTVQLKGDYAASEVYSTASEPPPAYKRESNSVKIAKITAFTIIISSFILGTFILGSSYLQAKASCDQVQALDSVLEKELMLETLQQVTKELPRAEALLGHDNAKANDLQGLDTEETIKKIQRKEEKSESRAKDNDENMIDNASDSDEPTEELSKYPGKLPLEFDLSELAATLLKNNKKSRMNCVVERKQAEELVDSPSKTVALPFGMNLTTDPKKARITGERISIFCEGGNDDNNKDKNESEDAKKNREEEDDNDEDVESIRPMFIPFQRFPIPYGSIPNRFPLTHMPQRMEPMMPPRQEVHSQNFLRQMPPPPPPFQQLPMRAPMPPQVMQAPPQPEHQPILRIQVHQIPLRELIHVADDVPQQITPQQVHSAIQQHQQQQQQQQQVQAQHQAPVQQQVQPQQQQQQQPFFQIQRLPLGLALQRAGITSEDLDNIHRLAEDRINEEFRRLADSSDEDDDDDSNSSEESYENQSSSSSAQGEQAKQAEHQQQQPDSQQSEQQQQSIEGDSRQARMQELPIQRLILHPLPEQPRDTMTPPMPDRRMPLVPGWGRSLAQPVRIPVPMMVAENVMPESSAQDDAQQQQQQVATAESERPHFVQPRSV